MVIDALITLDDEESDMFLLHRIRRFEGIMTLEELLWN